MAARLQQDAEGYAARVVEEATGDAERFSQIVTEYSKAPQVTRDRLYLDAMQQIMTSTTKVVVDKGSNNLIYLPLDKIMQMSGAPSAAAAPAAPATQAAESESSTLRRETFRRDRETRR
jgi:membrane protease subunit HflK